MNRQDIYTKVRTHLLKQNERATDEYGSCAYRGENGKKCAIGCLIPDDLYDYSFEGEGASELPQAIYDYLGVNYEEAIQKYSGDGGKDDGDLGFLIGLQNIHDCFDADEWEMCLGDFASAWELSV